MQYPPFSDIDHINGSATEYRQLLISRVVGKEETNMQMKLVGVAPVNFTNNAGETIKGQNIYVLFKEENTSGLKAEKLFLKDGIDLPKDTKLKLTDSVYHYDSKEHIFELAEKFEARQRDREADITSDKEEKASVLGDLKAKKDEVAKQPKKEAVEKATKAKGEEL